MSRAREHGVATATTVEASPGLDVAHGDPRWQPACSRRGSSSRWEGAADRAVAASFWADFATVAFPAPPSGFLANPSATRAAAATDSASIREVRWLASILRMKAPMQPSGAAPPSDCFVSHRRRPAPVGARTRRFAELAGLLRNGGPRDGDDPASAVLEAVQSVGVAPAELALPMIELARRLPSDRAIRARPRRDWRSGGIGGRTGCMGIRREMPDRFAAIWLLAAMRGGERRFRVVARPRASSRRRSSMRRRSARAAARARLRARCGQVATMVDRATGDAGAAGERSPLARCARILRKLESSLQRRRARSTKSHRGWPPRRAALPDPREHRAAGAHHRPAGRPASVPARVRATRVDRLLRNREVPVEPLQRAARTARRSAGRTHPHAQAARRHRSALPRRRSRLRSRARAIRVIAAYLSLLQRRFADDVRAARRFRSRTSRR